MEQQDFLTGNPVKTEQNQDITESELLAGICLLLTASITKHNYPVEQTSHNLSRCVEVLVNMTGLVRNGYVAFIKVPDNYDK